MMVTFENLKYIVVTISIDFRNKSLVCNDKSL